MAGPPCPVPRIVPRANTRTDRDVLPCGTFSGASIVQHIGRSLNFLVDEHRYPTAYLRFIQNTNISTGVSAPPYTNSVSYNCGIPSTPCTIIPTVICTHTFQRPPPTQYTTIVEDPQHRTPPVHQSFAHIFSSVHHQLSILPCLKTLNTGVSALQDERRLHHISPRAIPTSVSVTPTIRPERTTKSSARPNPQHRRLRSPRRTSAPPHFAQSDTN
jgi:hypothetical protein